MPPTNKKTFQNALLGLHDARSTQGTMARGRNVYKGASMSAKPGKVFTTPSTNLNQSMGNKAMEIRSAPVGAPGASPTPPNFVRENRARKALQANSGAVPTPAPTSSFQNAIERRMRKQ